MCKKDRLFLFYLLGAIGLAFGVAELALGLAVQELRSQGGLDKLAREIDESLSASACEPNCSQDEAK